MGSCLRAADFWRRAQLPRLFRPVACGGARPSTGSSMERAGLLTPFPPRAQATARVCMVSSFATELLEIRSREPSPSLHVLVVPGNPGIVGFYKDFVEALYENLGGQASVTAIGHISHGQKDDEHGRLFSLQEQIDHKIEFLEQELLHTEQSIIVVGHSIGAYIGLEIFKRFQKKVIFFAGLYPFLKLNKNAVKQSAIGYVARSSLLSKGVSLFASFIGSFQTSVTRSIVKRLLGSSWSATAIDAGCSHLLKYHTVCNVLFMAKTEFLKLHEEPDWNFMRAKQDQIAFLFGVDDHWGPLTHLEEISKHAPGVALSIEKEGHTHGYCCTEAGSFWVAESRRRWITFWWPVYLRKEFGTKCWWHGVVPWDTLGRRIACFRGSLLALKALPTIDGTAKQSYALLLGSCGSIGMRSCSTRPDPPKES